jgi:hypothetical protein
MATRKNTAPAEAFRLTLVSVPPDQEVTAIKFIKEMCGYRLERALELVEDLPAVVKEFATEDDACATHRLLAKIGAHCKLEHLVDGEVVGEDVQPAAEAQSRPIPPTNPKTFQADAERFLAGAAHIRGFRESLLGKALSDATTSVSKAFSLIDITKRSFEGAEGHEHEFNVLEIVIEHLEAALEALDLAERQGVATAEEVQS